MTQRMDELLEALRVSPGKKMSLLKDYDPGFTGKWMGKDEAETTLAEGIQSLAEMQDKLYAAGKVWTAGDLTGSGRCRQGRYDKARHVRR